jgi:hypothetical protein
MRPTSAGTSESRARIVNDMASGRVRPSFEATTTSPPRDTDMSSLTAVGKAVAGASPTAIASPAASTAAGVSAPAASRRRTGDAESWASQVDFDSGDTTGGRGGAVATPPTSVNKWELYCQKSEVVGRVGDWQERRMIKSGDVFYYHPATNRGAFHIEDVGVSAVLAVEKRVLPSPTPTPRSGTPRLRDVLENHVFVSARRRLHRVPATLARD